MSSCFGPRASERQRYVDLEDEVAPHVEHACTACGQILGGILQTAQVALVSLVQQIVGNDAHLGHDLAPVLELRAHARPQQGVSRCGGLALAFHQVMALLGVAVQVNCDIGVGQRSAVAYDVVTQSTA